MPTKKHKTAYQYLYFLLFLRFANLNHFTKARKFPLLRGRFFLLEGTDIPDSLKENREKFIQFGLITKT